MSRPNTSDRAFTLVELLVVVAIIALLLSILLPSLGRARDLAKSTVCTSTMRQIMLANITYATEQEGWFVPAYDNSRRGSPGKEPGEKWTSNPLLRELLSINPVAVEGWPPVDDDGRWLPASFPGGLICPNAAFAREGEYAASRQPPKGMYDAGRSWAINVYNVDEWNGWYDDYAGTRQTAVQTPSDSMAFIENFNGVDLNRRSGNHAQLATEDDVNYYVGEFDTHTMNHHATPAFRHPSDSMNGGFFDGHASNMKRGECVNLDNPGEDNPQIETLWNSGTKSYRW
jgi:prepilin-type N-terminal cleavage/methylation domain-containing protein/prepilin-type processing-associated H-X9-DG protein